MRRFNLLGFDPAVVAESLPDVSYVKAAEGCAFSNGKAYVTAFTNALPIGAFWFSIDEALDFYTSQNNYIVEWIDV